MRLVDGNGNDVPLEYLEPWCHFMEFAPGDKYPVTKIKYSMNEISITWLAVDPYED